MRIALFSFTLAALIPASTSADDKEGFKPLFNGKDLTGWTPIAKKDKDGKEQDAKGTWSVVEGELRCTGIPTGYLMTDKDYGDYVLKVKWRYPTGAKTGNSGVLIHLQRDDKWWPTSIEAQTRMGRAGDLWLNTPPDVKLDVDAVRRDANDKTMRHIWRDPKDENIEKPLGEWNEYEITCKGGDLTIAVNGRKVNEGKNCNLTKGRIALQSEGTEVHFKDIVIKPR
jgi:hypothetical protein